jgi:uncharacterized membrane protein YfcA
MSGSQLRTACHAARGACAGSASIVYITFGGLQWGYVALMVATGFASTYAGQTLTYHVVEAYGRRSVIVIAMATLLSLGAVTMGYEAVVALARDWSGHLLYHDSFCGGKRAA